MSKDNKNTFSAIIDNVKEYIDLKTEYYKLSFAEKVSLLMSRLVLIFCIAILSLSILLLLIILMNSLLMKWIGIDWAVILIEIGFIFILMAILISFKDRLIIKPISNIIIRIMLNPTDSVDNSENED